MYSKQEIKQLKKEFWEGFGLFCITHPILKRRKGKLMLYNTKMKGVDLKLDATRDGAYVILELNDKNEARRFERYEQFEQYKSLIEVDFPDGLVWNFGYRLQTGNEVCRIYTHKEGIDIHRREHWEEFYRFMADEMVKLERAFRKVRDVIT